MNKKLIALLAALVMILGCLAGCQGTPAKDPDNGGESGSNVDYAASVTLNMDSPTLKQEVTVKSFIDGDTTHFYVPNSVVDVGVLKARYLAVNTPESTGKIEPWGKKASNFTRSKLENAESIYIESDTASWNADSTGDRYLVWVWYKAPGSDTYRNLNIELLQNGLSLASNSADNQYGETCMAAIQQAKAQKLDIHSNKDDPDFYYGDAIPVTLKGLRTNIELYHNLTVAFEGVITRECPQSVYVEEYDAETDMYYGIYVYYGFNMTGTGLEILHEGNRVKFVGSVQYWEEGDSWQLADVKYVDMRPNDPKNIQLISSGHKPSYRLTEAGRFDRGSVEIECMTALDSEETVMKTFEYAKAVLGTSVSMKNLKVVDIYTTTTASSNGAMTLTCQAEDGITISVRTEVLYDESGSIVTADAYMGKTIDVQGVVDCFKGDYQIKVFKPSDITIVG